MRPWRLNRCRCSSSSPSSLQWGHGHEAVEISRKKWPGLVGNSLQWGHGHEAVEIPTDVARLVLDRLLQWGHGHEAVEITFADAFSSCPFVGFNGATAMRPWRFFANLS